MANRQIQDYQITASSEYGPNLVAPNGRLNSTKIIGVRNGCWIPSDSDTNPWFQVDLKENATLSEIDTQGRQDYSEWVKNYTVSYSNDGMNFKFYHHDGQAKVGDL